MRHNFAADIGPIKVESLTLISFHEPILLYEKNIFFVHSEIN